MTPWTVARQASLSITNSQSLLKLMSIESVMPSNHLILFHPLFLSPSIFPSIKVFSNEINILKKKVVLFPGVIFSSSLWCVGEWYIGHGVSGVFRGVLVVKVFIRAPGLPMYILELLASANHSAPWGLSVAVWLCCQFGRLWPVGCNYQCHLSNFKDVNEILELFFCLLP